ncbi:MAG: hypothetical protein QW156_04665 [Candidatus Aenigmatarchaeota archaeon]
MKEIIEQKINEYINSRRKVIPCNSNRASMLGHPCLRHIVYWRTQWENALLPEVDLQYIFEEGREQEQAVLRLLQNAGIQVIEQQRSFEWKEYQITGQIDAKILLDNKAIPLEIKSMSPYNFNSIESFEDIKKSKKYYIQGYVTQMQVYLLLTNSEIGLLALKNKSSGKIKFIECELDYEFAESIIKKAETINEHIKNLTLPDRIEPDDEVCGTCPFRHICLPERKAEGQFEISEGEELYDKLLRWYELKPIVNEYNELDDEIKKFSEGKNIIIKDFHITGKWITKIIPPQPEKEIKYWQKKIIKL